MTDVRGKALFETGKPGASDFTSNIDAQTVFGDDRTRFTPRLLTKLYVRDDPLNDGRQGALFRLCGGFGFPL